MEPAALLATVAFFSLAIPFFIHIRRHHGLSMRDTMLLGIGVKKVFLTKAQAVFRILIIIFPLGVFLIAQSNYCPV